MAHAQSQLQRPSSSRGSLEARWWLAGTAIRHEDTQRHRNAIVHAVRQASQIASSSNDPPPPLGTERREVVGPLAELLQDVAGVIDAPHAEDPSQPLDSANGHGLDWETVSAELGGDLAPPTAQAALAGMTATLTRWLLGGDSDASDVDTPDTLEEEDPDSDIGCASDPEPLHEGMPRAARSCSTNPQWYPWPDKQTCVLDIVRHLPRSLFSDSQMEIILWCLGVLGIDNCPSLFVLKTIDRMLQSHCGIESIRYRGPLGHVYYVNDLSAIIAQEMANPRVRPHLRFLPEDGGQKMSEAWHAARWLRELSPEIATPMVRVDQHDYYVHEPAKLLDGRLVVPYRWFTKATASGEQVIHGEGRSLHAVTFQDRRRGYIVHEHDVVTFATSDLSLPFPLMVKTFQTDNLPDPRNIIGRMVADGAGIHPWKYTDPQVGNLWRVRSQGHRVVSFLVWLYCDDTSGNMSKKWNKHNSWLFTPAGLPRSMAQQECNVHFLATSNLAPPLEMLHGIVAQLEKGQSEGFWAWDIVEHEMVLVIPAVLAVLGDNPMQSEIACHVGLAGKLFCRNCMVRGKEVAADVDVGAVRTRRDGSAVHDGDSESSTGSAASRSQPGHGGSHGREPDGRHHPNPGKAKNQETMQDIVDRARRFLGINEPRQKDQTLKRLEEVFQHAATIGGMTTAKKLKTEYGVKDTFQETFTERIFAYGRKLRGRRAEKQVLLDLFVAQELPSDTVSPVWRMKDLDPHQDTPVEILHVVLLGFIKYFWRDAVARVPKDRRDLLKTRLTSFDVSGLGISPLAGETLVTYAGSLTGRDFRAISQVAPFVLYDLVPEPCYRAWVSLSSLVPLVWQPEIRDLDLHLERLQAAIDYFLDCTAAWTPRWFNKPKFHIIRHLVAHIRRFGPAVLFATEGFESFNAVIRGKSIHSNHQAPSRDIARGFARANRIRHLLSGGVFLPQAPLLSVPSYVSTTTLDPRRRYSQRSEDWKTAGPLPLMLAARHSGGQVFGPLLPTDHCMSNPLPGHVAEILQLHGSPASRRGCADVILVEQYLCDGVAQPYGLTKIRQSGWDVARAERYIKSANELHTREHLLCVMQSTSSSFVTLQLLSIVKTQSSKHAAEVPNNGPSATTVICCSARCVTIGSAMNPPGSRTPLSEAPGGPQHDFLRSKSSSKFVFALPHLLLAQLPMDFQYEMVSSSPPFVTGQALAVPVMGPPSSELEGPATDSAPAASTGLSTSYSLAGGAEPSVNLTVPTMQQTVARSPAQTAALRQWCERIAHKWHLKDEQYDDLKQIVNLGSNIDNGYLRILVWNQTTMYGILNRIESQDVDYQRFGDALNGVEGLLDTSWTINDDQGLIASVSGKGRKSLEDATMDILKKMKKGGVGSPGSVKAEYQIRFAILRRWTREEYGLILPPSRRGDLRLPTAGEDDDPQNGGDAPMGSPDPIQHGDDFAQPTKKRKISDVDALDMPVMPATVGKVPKGEDFWSKIDLRLAEKESEWGNNIKDSSEWRLYIDETVSRDRRLFGSSSAVLTPLPLTSLPQATVQGPSSSTITPMRLSMTSGFGMPSLPIAGGFTGSSTATSPCPQIHSNGNNQASEASGSEVQMHGGNGMML
ncbi:hypothetical protein BN946_scf184815.g63 [Trametes cinnabarina]|uniref:Uncharacterized protein n=1 Tax=Pycnoporus cinnabarinus TaxID=5643 RepID=A0A060S2N6_PYCCI|nr:hypothetical protein BN946_scf184815.g63 [Trametes cinnabarina]